MMMVRVMEALRHDLSFALRGLRRSPGLTLAIVVTLSLGVGANASVFTAIDRVFFQAPPGIRDPASIRRLYARIYNHRGPQYGPTGQVTPFLRTKDYLALDSAARGIARITGDYLDRREAVEPGGQRVRTTWVTPGYFDLLGVRPARGRFFTPDELRVPGAPSPIVVLSDAFWRRHFGSDSSITGKTFRLGETVYTIVGVAPRGFEGIELEVTDLWAPLNNVAGGNITSLKVLARLEPNASERVLDQVLTTGYRRAHIADQSVDDSSSIIVAPLLSARGPESVGTTVRRIPGLSDRNIALLGRLGMVGIIVLTIAVANVASLLLMRALRRRREIAIRIALGISRPRLVLQLVAESTMLAILAGGVALLVANATGGLLRTQLAAFQWTETIVDQRVIWLSMLAALVAGVSAGVAPALLALRTDVSSALKAGGGATSRGDDLRTPLLVTQAALCTALLVCGGTFLQSLRRAGEFDRGFDQARTIQLAIPASHANAEPELVRLAERLRAAPGVEVVGRSYTPIGAIGMSSKVGPNASDTIGLGARGPSLEFVEPAFLQAAGITVESGRLMTPEDDFALVAVLNESLARALFPRGKAVGSCVHVREPSSPCREIIGVVRDIRWDVTVPATYRVYVPLTQAWTAPNRALIPNYLYVRMRAAALPADVARLRGLVSPLMAYPSDLAIQRLSDVLAPQLRTWRIAAVLFLLFGALGLIAAATGIYGLVAYDVVQRSRDIGVRIALGATSGRVMRLVMGTGLRLVLTGIGLGMLVAFGIGRVMVSLLFETTPFDPAALLITTLVLLAATVLASLVPAWRACRLNPARLLSTE